MTRPPSADSSGDAEAGAGPDLMSAARRRLPPEVDVVTLVSGAAPAEAVALGGAPASHADTDSSKAHVAGVSRELFRGLAGVGTHQRPPRAAWTGCDDLGGQVAYRVSGRLEAVAGSAGGFLDEVRRTVQGAGFQLSVVSTSPDPVTWQGEHDDVRLQLTGYASQPVVLLSLTGRCLDVGAADEALLAEPPERLDLG